MRLFNKKKTYNPQTDVFEYTGVTHAPLERLVTGLWQPAPPDTNLVPVINPDDTVTFDNLNLNDYHTHYDALLYVLPMLKQAITHFDAKIRSLQIQINQLKESDIQQSERIDVLEKYLENFQQMREEYADIATTQQLLETRDKELQAKQRELIRESQKLSKFDQLTELVQKLVDQNNQQSADIDELTTHINNQALQLDQLTEDNHRLNQLVRGHDEDVSRMLKIARDRDMTLVFHGVEETSSYIRFKFQNQGANYSDDKLKSMCEALPAVLEWTSSPPKASVGRRIITLDWDIRETQDIIKSKQFDWLQDLVVSETNVGIFAPKGSGKTTLAINYIKRLLTYLPDAEVKFVQPKPDESSIITLDDGSTLKPNYLGFNGFAQAVEDFANTWKYRNDAKEKALSSDTPIPEFPNQFWIIDEFQVGLSQSKNPKEIAQAIKDGVSFGRTLGMNVLIIMQNGNVKNINGWTKADLKNFNCVYIGDAIKVGIDYSDTTSEKKTIEADWTLYRQGQSKYYGLIRKPGHSAFMQLLPVVNQQPTVVNHPKTTTNDNQQPPEPSHSKDTTSISCHTLSQPFTLNPYLNTHLLITQNKVTCKVCGCQTFVGTKGYKPNKSGNLSVRCHNKSCTSSSFTIKGVA